MTDYVRDLTREAIDRRLELPAGVKDELVEATIAMDARDFLAVVATSRLALLHQAHGGPLVCDGYITTEREQDTKMRWQLNRPARIYAVGGRLEFEEGDG